MEPAGPLGTKDAYADLLNRTRELDPERRALRDDWYRTLAVRNKEELLFELEVLLKATACFANPRNHPGPPRRSPVVAQDFREPTVLLRDGLTRATQLIRMLLGSGDRRYVFHRYLETVLPDERRRRSLGRAGGPQRRPEDGLAALRQSLTETTTVLEGLLRAPRIPFRIFYATAALAEREVAQNTFFNPLRALEFRPEFDTLRSSEILAALRKAPPGPATELATLTVLSLARMLHYLRLLSRIAAEQRELTAARAYLVASVLFSDARALSEYLLRSAGPALSSGYARDVLGVPRTEIGPRSADLARRAGFLAELRGAFHSVGSGLRLEMRRAFVHGLPPLDTLPTDQSLREAIEATVSSVRPALRHFIVFLLRALGASVDENAVFEDPAAARETLERLRRDTWMFGQIVRGFHMKARFTELSDTWPEPPSPHYVKQFLSYFRSMGFPLVGISSYPRATDFLSAMTHLEEGEIVDPGALARTVNECAAFQAHLEALFDALSTGDVLRDVPFDRRAAAEVLRSYLRSTAA